MDVVHAKRSSFRSASDQQSQGWSRAVEGEQEDPRSLVSRPRQRYRPRECRRTILEEIRHRGGTQDVLEDISSRSGISFGFLSAMWYNDCLKIRKRNHEDDADPPRCSKRRMRTRHLWTEGECEIIRLINIDFHMLPVRERVKLIHHWIPDLSLREIYYQVYVHPPMGIRRIYKDRIPWTISPSAQERLGLSSSDPSQESPNANFGGITPSYVEPSLSDGDESASETDAPLLSASPPNEQARRTGATMQPLQEVQSTISSDEESEDDEEEFGIQALLSLKQGQNMDPWSSFPASPSSQVDLNVKSSHISPSRPLAMLTDREIPSSSSSSSLSSSQMQQSTSAFSSSLCSASQSLFTPSVSTTETKAAEQRPKFTRCDRFGGAWLPSRPIGFQLPSYIRELSFRFSAFPPLSVMPASEELIEAEPTLVMGSSLSTSANDTNLSTFSAPLSDRIPIQGISYDGKTFHLCPPVDKNPDRCRQPYFFPERICELNIPKRRQLKETTMNPISSFSDRDTLNISSL